MIGFCFELVLNFLMSSRLIGILWFKMNARLILGLCFILICFQIRIMTNRALAPDRTNLLTPLTLLILIALQLRIKIEQFGVVVRSFDT